jgi:hypothetical protein
LVALRARRTSAVGLAILVCTVCAWLGAAAPAEATITSLSVGNVSAAEQSLFSGTVATFITDDPFDTFSFSVDWGDGTTSSGPATLNGDNGSVSGSHTYAEDGTYTLMVRITESGGSPGTRSASASVTVGEADATLVGVAPITISEGTTFAGPVATLTDPGSPDPASKFSATIDWGDGTTTAGTISGGSGSFTISGSHTYTDELAAGVIRVSASEPEGGSTLGPAKDQINVTDADTLTAHPLTFAASDGVPFSGTVATFSNTLATTPAGDFSATVNWGDGTTSSGSVSLSGGTLTVVGSHTYNSPPTNYAVGVQLTDDPPGTATAAAASTVNLSAGKPSAVTLGASGVTITGATLNGAINPNGDATSCSVEYGKTTAYGATKRCSSVGSGNSSQAVSVSLSGLAPATTYHYRVVATNSKGTTVGVDQTFTTPALVSRLRVRRDGSVQVVVNAPGSGIVDVIVMAGANAFGHARVRAKHPGPLKILAPPNRGARRLIKHHRHRIALRITVRYTPHQGRAISITVHGLHLPVRN